MAANLPIFVLLFLALAEPILGDHHSTWNYDVSDKEYGPLGWAKKYPKHCAGESQSPIDIVTAKTEYDGSLDQFTMKNFDSVPNGEKFEVKNNGHGYGVYLAPNVFEVSGGGLPGTFTTLQFHFHWGSVDSKGSEHTVDGTMYPAGVHFVHLNKKYSTLGEALSQKDGLAVLGVIYKVGAENPALTSFIKYAVNVTEPSSMANLTMTHSLASLLPANTTDYYRYSGGLTTPTCNEVVTWTVFKNYATISQEQLTMLRGLKYKVDNATVTLTDTFRPVQPLNSRVVKRSFKTAADKKKKPSGESSHVTGAMATVVSAMFAAVLLM